MLNIAAKKLLSIEDCDLKKIDEEKIHNTRLKFID
jgi:hypothetical protein